MNTREAGDLLLLMKGTWQRFCPDEVATNLWIDDLSGFDRDPAYQAFRNLRDTETRAPSWALFKAAVGAEAQRSKYRREVEAEEWAPPSEEAKARVHAIVAGLSETLKVKRFPVKQRVATGPLPTAVDAVTYDATHPAETA